MLISFYSDQKLNRYIIYIIIYIQAHEELTMFCLKCLCEIDFYNKTEDNIHHRQVHKLLLLLLHNYIEQCRYAFYKTLSCQKIYRWTYKYYMQISITLLECSVAWGHHKRLRKLVGRRCTCKTFSISIYLKLCNIINETL